MAARQLPSLPALTALIPWYTVIPSMNSCQEHSERYSVTMLSCFLQLTKTSICHSIGQMLRA